MLPDQFQQGVPCAVWENSLALLDVQGPRKARGHALQIRRLPRPWSACLILYKSNFEISSRHYLSKQNFDSKKKQGAYGVPHDPNHDTRAVTIVGKPSDLSRPASAADLTPGAFFYLSNQIKKIFLIVTSYENYCTYKGPGWYNPQRIKTPKQFNMRARFDTSKTAMRKFVSCKVATQKYFCSSCNNNL